LIDLLNLSRLVAMPGYSQAVGGVASGKGKEVGNRERIEVEK
jgi:hypothetical protein